MWNGGTWINPYSKGFTSRLKKDIKQRDTFRCQICNEKNRLLVHHIDYTRTNHSPLNLITLCIYCHSKTNIIPDRLLWKSFFKKKMRNIKQ